MVLKKNIYQFQEKFKLIMYIYILLDPNKWVSGHLHFYQICSQKVAFKLNNKQFGKPFLLLFKSW